MYRPEWWPNKDLISIAMQVHMITTGASDPEHNDLYIRCLHHALKHWKPSLPEHKKFDDAIKYVVETALLDYQIKTFVE